MNRPLYGMLAEFPTAEALLAAVRRARDAGLGPLEAYTPFPVDGLAEALGQRGNLVAPITCTAGAVSGALAYFMQWYAAVIDYPINVGGRALHSWPSFIPITFELTILGAAIAAVVAMLVLNGLPKLWHPLFATPAFDLASRNRFYLLVRSNGQRFDAAACRAQLESYAPLLVCEVAS